MDQQVGVLLLAIEQHQDADVVLHQLQSHLLVGLVLALVALSEQAVELPDAHVRRIQSAPVVQVLADRQVRLIRLDVDVGLVQLTTHRTRLT